VADRTFMRDGKRVAVPSSALGKCGLLEECDSCAHQGFKGIANDCSAIDPPLSIYGSDALRPNGKCRAHRQRHG
jgi:hypothetical protein